MTTKTETATHVISMGCRLNAAEADLIEQIVPAHSTPTIVINTCAVTAQAVREARQLIRRHRKQSPDARIVVTGCAADTEYTTFATMPEIDLLVPNTLKTDARAYAQLSPTATHLNPVMTLPTQAPVSPRARAYVPIQNGCNHRCTFCIIPYGRGPSRSVAIDQVIDYIKALVQQGSQEVVLTGVDLTAWGQDLPDAPPLGRLVRQILRQVPDLPWLRLSSIDAAEADPELQEMIAYETRFTPYLHLSLQSGSDLILKRMKRRHSRAQALDFIAQMRQYRPDLTLGADFIAGFPTEDESMFADTLSFITQANIVYVHAFGFSPRQGTPAARMPQLPSSVIKERTQRLRALAAQQLQQHCATHVGSHQQVLIETATTGRCADFTPVLLTQSYERGTLQRLYVTHSHDDKIVCAPAKDALC